MNDLEVAEFLRARIPEPDVEHDLAVFRRRARRDGRRRITARSAATAVGFAALVTLAFVWGRDDSPGADRLQTTATTDPQQADTTGPSPSIDSTSLELALRSLSLDTGAVPASWLSLPFCGVDQGRVDEAAVRRCVLDAHLARFPAVMLDTTSDTVTVLKTRVDGRVELVATAKAAQPEREWNLRVCERLSTRPASGAGDPTVWQSVNCEPDAQLETITRPQPPEWFLSRAEVPLCGIEATVEQDRTDRGRQCFVDAYEAGRRAEFAFSATSESPDISSVSYWYRIVGPNDIEILVRQESRRWPPVGGEPHYAAWIRYACTGIEFRDLLPRLVPQACRVIER